MSFHGIIHVIIYVIIHVVMHMINWGSDSNWENGQNSWVFWESGEFPKFLKESEGGLFFNYRKFLKCLAIREISQIKYPDIWGISQLSSLFWKLEIFWKKWNLWNSPNTLDNLREVFLIIRNFSNVELFWEFPKFQSSSKV